MKNKCEIFFDTPESVKKKMNTFFEENDIAIQHMTQTEHVGLDNCTYITVTLVYIEINHPSP